MQPVVQLPLAMLVVTLVTSPAGGALPSTVFNVIVTESSPAPRYFGRSVAAGVFATRTTMRKAGIARCPDGTTTAAAGEPLPG